MLFECTTSQQPTEIVILITVSQISYLHIWDPTVLDHLIDIDHDTYHPTIVAKIDEEDFTSFGECTSATRTDPHHDS